MAASVQAACALGELPSYGFNGEESHPQTGLQHLRARYYDAESGRFGVQDSYLGQLADPLSLNRYLYCLSDPLNLIDPSGYAGSRNYSSGRLGSVYKPPRARWTLTNRTGYKNNLAASYEAQGKRNLAYVLSGGLLKDLTANKLLDHYLKYENSLKANNKSSTRYWYRCALAAQQELLRYCNGDVAKMESYIAKATKNRLLLHTVLDIAGLFSFVADLSNAQIYYKEGDSENGTTSMVSAIPFFGGGTTASKYLKQGTHIANAAEAIFDARKIYEHTSPSKLERNMKNAGILTPAYSYNAHHIVAKGDKRAEPARSKLSSFGIDIDDAANGVFLPVGKNVTEGTNHWGLHSEEYYKAINKKLESVTSKEEAIKVLEGIGTSLAKGTFK